ncbi:hypothetical protein DFH08DRAFT_894690 [Mycena albidolilacea]|uniref:Uncharacterized protein n=1 Tax=Mycena albidolilacea TaxID=1033008 RepID=A0AAD6ZAN4_9AGAR|nr:hypothetical protein DFH08DRAFT_894690 [Mycena albidolilacea]
MTILASFLFLLPCLPITKLLSFPRMHACRSTSFSQLPHPPMSPFSSRLSATQKHQQLPRRDGVDLVKREMLTVGRPARTRGDPRISGGCAPPPPRNTYLRQFHAAWALFFSELYRSSLYATGWFLATPHFDLLRDSNAF